MITSPGCELALTALALMGGDRAAIARFCERLSDRYTKDSVLTRAKRRSRSLFYNSPDVFRAILCFYPARSQTTSDGPHMTWLNEKQSMRKGVDSQKKREAASQQRLPAPSLKHT